MDRFFDGTFITYGIEVISFAERDQEDRIDPMVYIFPRMTKCMFHKFGRSGEVEKHDAMCILPLNIVNEKIYIFLWFWMLLLLVLTFLMLLCRYEAKVVVNCILLLNHEIPGLGSLIWICPCNNSKRKDWNISVLFWDNPTNIQNSPPTPAISWFNNRIEKTMPLEFSTQCILTKFELNLLFSFTTSV